MNQIKEKRKKAKQQTKEEKGKIERIKAGVRNDMEFLRRQWISIALFILALFIFKGIFHGLCTFRVMTGIPCPSCGMTRAVVLFLRGHIGESLRMHPLWPFVVLLPLIGLYNRYIGCKRKYLCYIYIIVLGVAIILFYLYRMYRYFPNQEPMIYYTDNILFRLWHLKGK